MAGGGSGGRGAYWIGALVGLVFSGSLAAVLSLVTPLSNTGPSGAQTPVADAGANANRAGSGETIQSEATASPGEANSADTATAAAPSQAETAAATPTPAAPAANAPMESGDQVALATPQPAAPSAPAQPAPAQPQPAQPQPAQPQPAQPEPATPTPEASAPASPAPVEEASAPTVASPSGLTPFKANAEIYSGDRSQPLLAIVLTDVTNENPTRLDEIMLLPGPLAIVVPASSAGAADAILDARDAGFEAMVGVSGEDVGGDVAAVLTSRLAASPTVIGAALSGDALQASAAAEDAVSTLAENGFALLDMTVEGGGAPFRLAKSRNAPAAANGRRFDDSDSSALVFQSLERAAFDARRTGAFVVVGSAKPAVLTGLRRWMNVKANRSVAVAPLSAVIEKISRQ